MPEEVFGSWVIWMWELCCAPGFRKIWYDVPDEEDNQIGGDAASTNYIPGFCKIISIGVDMAKKYSDEAPRAAARERFFQAVSDELGGCDEITQWLNRDTLRPGSHIV